MVTRYAAAAAVVVMACSAPMSGTDAGEDASVVMPVSALKAGYNARFDGWPADAGAMVGAAAFDGTVFAATGGQVLSLPLTDTRWAPLALTLETDEVVTSLKRIDSTIVVTTAGPSGGALWLKPASGEFAKSANAPAKKLWGVVKKGSEFLLATSGGLFAASDLTGMWVKRTRVETGTPFVGKVSRLVAGAGQLRMFAAGDSTASTGGLFYSDDTGINWAASSVKGNVRALEADGTAVLLETSVDGQQRSDNYGNTFKPMTVGGGVSGFAFGASLVFAATDAGVQTSADLGATWGADSQANAPVGPARRVFTSGSLLVVDTEAGPLLATQSAP